MKPSRTFPAFLCLVSSRASGVLVSVWLSSSLSSALELRETDQKPTVIIVGPTPCVCLRRRRCLPTQVPRKRGTGKSSPHCFLGLHAYASARGVVVGFVAGARTATHAAAAFSFCRDRGTRTAAWAERRVGPSWEGVDRTQETLWDWWSDEWGSNTKQWPMGSSRPQGLQEEEPRPRESSNGHAAAGSLRLRLRRRRRVFVPAVCIAGGPALCSARGLQHVSPLKVADRPENVPKA